MKRIDGSTNLINEIVKFKENEKLLKIQKQDETKSAIHASKIRQKQKRSKK